jgi:putative Holliday junction resolvase
MTGEAVGRILAVDPGERRVGLAVSDPLGVVAQGLPTFDKKRGDVFAHLRALAAEYQLERVVVGHPLSMSGRENEASRAADEFARAIEQALGLPVERWD